MLATVTVSRGRHHAESIAPAIDFVCRRAGVRLSELDAVGVDVGPGLFTGLRVGVGTAKALAFALERPLVGVEQPRGPGPGRGDVGRRAGHARGPRGRRPARRGLRGPTADAPRRACRGSTTRQRRTPEALADELLRLGEPMRAGRATGRAATGAILGAVPGAVRAAKPSTSRPRPCWPRWRCRGRPRGRSRRRDAVLPHYLRDAETRINWETRRPARRRGALNGPGLGRRGRGPGRRRRPRRGPDAWPARCGSCRLRRRHLRTVVQIEEANYPRPWSSTVFLSELAQRRSRRYTVATIGPLVVGLLRAHDGGGGRPHHHPHRRPGVAPPQHRHGAAPRPGPRRARPRGAPPHARGQGVEHLRPGAVPALRLRAGRRAAQLLPRDRRGRHRHVGARHRHRRLRPAPGRHRRPPRVDDRERRRRARARDRDLVRRHGRGRRGRRGRGAVVGGLEPGGPARRLRRGRARARRPGPSRAPHPGHRARRSGGPGSPGRGPRRRGRHRRPRPHRLAAGRGERGQGAGPGLGRPLRRRQPPRGPSLRRPARPPRHRVARGRAPGLGRPHPARVDGGPGPLPAPGPDPRRRRRRGLRQGGPVPRPRLPRRPGHRAGRRRRATPPPSPSPGPCSATGSTSPSAGSRRRWSTPCAATPTPSTEDVAASFQQAVVDVLVAKAGRAAVGDGCPGAVPGRGGGRQRGPARGRRPRRAPSSGCPPTSPAGPCAPTTRP